MSSKELFEMSTKEKLELAMELIGLAMENLNEEEEIDCFNVSFLDLALDLIEDIIDYTDMI